MVFSSVYGPPFVRQGDVRRDATMDDFRNFAKLAHSFPELDMTGGTIVEPNDTPLDSRHLDMVLALQTLSDKAYMGSVTSGPNAADTIRMTEILLGGRESIEKTPGVISLINVNSPLRFDDRMLAAMFEYVPRQPARDHHAVPADGRDVAGLDPRDARPAARRGAHGHRARRSSSNPGCPVILGSFLSNTDMQSGSPALGTPESAIGLLCTGQMARRYGLPWRSGGALTSSQTCDAQAAYEAMMVMTPTFLAGTNYVMHAAGWLEAGLVACYEKFIVDIEILRMLQVQFTPLEIDEESLAFGAHEEVGAGGHFLGAVHTLERFRDCFYRPLLSSTENFQRWERLGGRDATERAGEIYKKTLEEYEEPPMDDAVRSELDEYVDAPPHRARRLRPAAPHWGQTPIVQTPSRGVLDLELAPARHVGPHRLARGLGVAGVDRVHDLAQLGRRARRGAVSRAAPGRRGTPAPARRGSRS